MESDSEEENNFRVNDDVEVVEVDEQQAAEWERDDESDHSDDEESELQEALLESDALATFRQHTDSIICCDINPNNSSVLTGGQDDRAYVWDINTTEVIAVCTGHNETVSCVSYSFDGKFFVTGDLNGSIQVWGAGNNQQVWNTDVSSELIWLRWHPSSQVLLGGTGSGEIWMWAVPSGNCKLFPSYGCQTDCGTFFPDGLRALVGYSDGSIRILDLKKGTMIHEFKGSGHKSLVSVVDCFSDNVICASGSQDRTVKIINSQSGKVIATLECNATNDEDDAGVESLAFHPSQSILVSGTLNGTVKVWDIPTQKETVMWNNQAGVVKLIWHPNSPLVYCASLDGIIRRWDSRNGQQDSQWVAHNNQILDMALSRDGTRLITASDDTTSAVLNTA